MYPVRFHRKGGFLVAKEEKEMEAKDKPFGFVDKLAYASGDFGCNMSFALKSYITIYWTQYMGIDSVLMSGLLIVVQIWDAIDDPLIGAIIDADTHKYKRNKFLAYIWLGSIGLVIGGALCFMPFPNAPYMVKCILFVVGYMIWDAFYTVANVPYGSMLSLITDDPEERAQLSSWRSVGSTAGSIATGIIVPLIIYDASDNLRGGLMFWMALIFGVVGFICFQYTVHNTTIRVDTTVKTTEDKEDKPKFNWFRSVGNFLRSRPALGATLAPFGMFISYYGASTATTVMFQSYFHAANISGILSMVSYLGVFIYPFFIDKLVARYGKKELCTIGSVIACIGYGLLIVLPISADTTGLIMYTVCNIIAALGAGLINNLAWSLVADATDYNEWKHGSREEGTMYSLHSFFRKVGQSIGPSLGLLLAAALGYDESLGSAQTAATALNMRYLSATMYLLGGVIELISYGLVYNLNKATTDQMNEELNERHAAQAAEAASNE